MACCTAIPCGSDTARKGCCTIVSSELRALARLACAGDSAVTLPPPPPPTCVLPTLLAAAGPPPQVELRGVTAVTALPGGGGAAGPSLAASCSCVSSMRSTRVGLSRNWPRRRGSWETLWPWIQMQGGQIRPEQVPIVQCGSRAAHCRALHGYFNSWRPHTKWQQPAPKLVHLRLLVLRCGSA